MLARFGSCALVQLLEHAGLDLALQERGRRHHHVEAGVAGQQAGLEHVVGVEDVVGDLDAGLLFEVLDGVFGDVVRPVVDVEDLLLGGSGARSLGLFCFFLLAAGRDRQRDRPVTASPARSELLNALTSSGFLPATLVAARERNAEKGAWATTYLLAL